MKTLLGLTLLALAPLGTLAAAERFACNANALNKPERARHQEQTLALLGAIDEKRELAEGYAFRLPAGRLVTAAEWVSSERRCCPFFTFVLEQTRDGGPLWLRITGPEGVKAFMREEFGL